MYECIAVLHHCPTMAVREWCAGLESRCKLWTALGLFEIGFGRHVKGLFNFVAFYGVEVNIEAPQAMDML